MKNEGDTLEERFLYIAIIFADWSGKQEPWLDEPEQVWHFVCLEPPDKTKENQAQRVPRELGMQEEQTQMSVHNLLP